MFAYQTAQKANDKKKMLNNIRIDYDRIRIDRWGITVYYLLYNVGTSYFSIKTNKDDRVVFRLL